MAINWYLGTMGFSYKDWSGPFYPSEIPSQRYLAYYSQFFNAVEIDSTFYGTPRKGTVLRWKAVTPRDFKFSLKTPREITHRLRLVGMHALDSMNTFLDTARLLEHKLGVVLLQFPPTFDVGGLESLVSFLDHLTKDVRYAVEFRHPSWYRAETAEVLRSTATSWATTEYPGLPQHEFMTASHAYVRWIGQHGRFERHDCERLDMTPRLRSWKKNLTGTLPNVSDIYGFFNNDYAGFAPATCNKFKSLMGLPTKSLYRPRQGRLF